MRVVVVLIMLAGCAQQQIRQSSGVCDINDAALEEAKAISLKHIDDPGGDFQYGFIESRDYGDECGLLFDIKLKPEIAGYILATPAEVILTKENLTYIETILIPHDTRFLD